MGRLRSTTDAGRKWRWKGDCFRAERFYCFSSGGGERGGEGEVGSQCDGRGIPVAGQNRRKISPPGERQPLNVPVTCDHPQSEATEEVEKSGMEKTDVDSTGKRPSSLRL